MGLCVFGSLYCHLENGESEVEMVTVPLAVLEAGGEDQVESGSAWKEAGTPRAEVAFADQWVHCGDLGWAGRGLVSRLGRENLRRHYG